MRHPRKVRPLVCGLQRAICNSDGTYVLHGAYPELGHVDHVILIVREIVPEELLIKIDSILDDAEDLLGIAILKLALPCEYTHRRLRRLRLVFNHLVFTCAYAVNIRTNRRTNLEVPKEALRRRDLHV